MEEKNINQKFAIETNEKERHRFLSVPYHERTLFISHCIRAELKEQLKQYAESLGYRAHIVGGGSIVHKLIIKENPKAVVGIACEPELCMAVEKLNIPLQVVLLDTDGCKDTTVNIEEAKRVIALKEDAAHPANSSRDANPVTT